MLNLYRYSCLGIAAIGLAAQVAPAQADVKGGVDAWERGDYATAVAEWQGPAAEGDADAMFNLAQAYRLGRGVAQDGARSEDLYRQAAEAGHVRAADTYGLVLFQSGRREQAMPYIADAARRGDPRSQYLLGIAHFNGDLMPKDWVRAYALLTLANGAGLPQAASAITQMDQYIPLIQREEAAGLARQLSNDAQTVRATDLAAAELGNPTSSGVPREIRSTEVAPSVAASREAVARAQTASGTGSPAQAGASFARPVEQAVQAPVPAPVPATAPAPAANRPASVAASGPWRVQLGAFSVRENAERLWTRLGNRPELAGRERLLIPAGRVIKLQAGGFASREQANAACNALKAAGQDCLVTRD